MPLNGESERHVLFKEKITKQALRTVRNKKEVALCSDFFFFSCMKMQNSENAHRRMVLGEDRMGRTHGRRGRD